MKDEQLRRAALQILMMLMMMMGKEDSLRLYRHFLNSWPFFLSHIFLMGNCVSRARIGVKWQSADGGRPIIQVYMTRRREGEEIRYHSIQCFSHPLSPNSSIERDLRCVEGLGERKGRGLSISLHPRHSSSLAPPPPLLYV